MLCTEGIDSGSSFILLPRESMKGKGSIRGRGRVCVAIDRKIRKLCCGLYMLLSLRLVSYCS